MRIFKAEMTYDSGEITEVTTPENVSTEASENVAASENAAEVPMQDEISLLGEDETKMEVAAPSDDEDFDYSPQMIYLSKMMSKKSGDFSALWDSSATNTVVGKGRQASRLLDGYVVIHNDPVEGWASENSNDTKESLRGQREDRKIIVASGEVVKGKSVDQINLGVKARTMNEH